jgi:hypothetical protein
MDRQATPRLSDEAKGRHQAKEIEVDFEIGHM